MSGRGSTTATASLRRKGRTVQVRRYRCEIVRRGRVGLLSDLRVWAGTLRLLGGRFPPLSPLERLSAGGSSAVHLEIAARARCAAAVRGSFVWEEGAEVQPRHAFLHVPPVRQNLLVAPPGDRAVAAASPTHPPLRLPFRMCWRSGHGGTCRGAVGVGCGGGRLVVSVTKHWLLWFWGGHVVCGTGPGNSCDQKASVSSVSKVTSLLPPAYCRTRGETVLPSARARHLLIN